MLRVYCYGCLFLLLLLCTSVNSSCWLSGVRPDDNGRFPTTCAYGDWTFESGSRFKAPVPYCEWCTCRSGSLSCCGYGWKGGPVGIEGCHQVTDLSTCDRIFVDDADETQPCAIWDSEK